jgi:hypothetical protein
VAARKAIARRSLRVVALRQKDDILHLAHSLSTTDDIAQNVALAIEQAASGEVHEAEQMLAIQVARLLRHAGRGGVVSNELRELVCGFALELAQRTKSVPWLDWVIELHLITDAPLSSTLLRSLEASRALLGRADGLLLDQYIETMQQRHHSLSDDDLERVSHLRELRGPRRG